MKKTSDNLRKSADGIDAVLTSSISPEQKKDKTPKTPTQTSSDSSSNQVPTDSSQSSNEKQEDNAQNLTPKSASQVVSDGQNNPQEQVPQTAPAAPVVQSENTQPAQQPEVAPQQAPKIEIQPQLTDAQKLAQVQQILGNIESKFINLQAESNSITLTAAELASLDQASSLLQQSPVSLSTADQRALLINDKDARDDYIKKLEDQIKAEKEASNDLKKIKKLEEKLAQVSNHNNYNLNVMNSLSGINSVLQNGTYLDAKLQIPREQKFALELIKKRDLLRS